MRSVRLGAPTAGYLPELDGIRAIAILLVMAYHLWDYRGTGALGRVLTTFARQGWIGVDIFFALSGFLITRILLATRDSPRYYSSFYIRRSLRIFPLYYAVLIALCVGGFVMARCGIGLGDLTLAQLRGIWVNFLYLSNFALAYQGSNAIPLDISWSLAVEEQFYLVYPFAVRRLERAGLTRALLAALILAVPLRWLSFVYSPGNHYGPYALPYCRMDALAVGGLAALALDAQLPLLRRCIAAAAAPLWVAALAAVMIWHRGEAPIVILGYTLTAAATAATIVRLQLGGWQAVRSLLASRILVAIGKVSYGLYLLHLFVRAALDRLPWFAPEARQDLTIAFLRAGTMAAASLAVAWLSWSVFESPILALKTRLDPLLRRAEASASPPAAAAHPDAGSSS